MVGRNQTSQSATTRQPPFGTAKASATVTLLAAVLLAVALWVAPRLTTEEAAPIGAVVYGGTLGSLAVILGMLPLSFAGPRGVQPTIIAYFVGMFARLIVCATGWLIGALAYAMPGSVILLALAWVYIPLQLVEAAFVARYLWLKDVQARTPAGLKEALVP